jgi:hypothetical protein
MELAQFVPDSEPVRTFFRRGVNNGAASWPTGKPYTFVDESHRRKTPIHDKNRLIVESHQGTRMAYAVLESSSSKNDICIHQSKKVVFGENTAFW